MYHLEVQNKIIDNSQKIMAQDCGEKPTVILFEDFCLT